MTDYTNISIALTRSAIKVNRMLIKFYEKNPHMNDKTASLLLSGYIYCILKLNPSDEMEFQPTSIVHGTVGSIESSDMYHEQYWLEFYDERKGRVAVIDPIINADIYRNGNAGAMQTAENIGSMLKFEEDLLNRYSKDHEVMN